MRVDCVGGGVRREAVRWGEAGGVGKDWKVCIGGGMLRFGVTGKVCGGGSWIYDDSMEDNGRGM